MKYKPVAAVWEITMGCNMRCKHCGSSCETSLPGELSTEEALRLCDELGKLDFEFITLSGGEPTTRKDWHLIAKRLKDNGITPTMITNGWLIDEGILDKAIASGVNTIAISIDGLEETHDFMRKEGSFKRSMHALDLMKEKGIPSAIITTINNKNIRELPLMRELFMAKGVTSWQLQFALPMGNMSKNSDLIIYPEQVDEIIDFAYNSIGETGKMKIFFADCIGYYNSKEIEVRKAFRKEGYMWNGCGAGKNNMGILHNGDIAACTSIRNKEFIEGNIREKPLREIWTNPGAFKWNRSMDKSKLTGFCGKCGYGDLCLGGCANTRLCTESDIYKSNRFCSYRNAIEKVKQYIGTNMPDIDSYYAEAEKLSKENQNQIAELLLERYLEGKPQDIKALNLWGYVSFMLKNYAAARDINKKVLSMEPDNVYANKGLGLSLGKLGCLPEALLYLNRAMSLTDEAFMDPYHDAAVLLLENNEKKKAAEVLLKAKEISEEFYEENKTLYEEVMGR